MKRSQPNVDRQTVRQLVLARLMVRTKRPLSRTEVIKAVAAAISPPLPAAAAADAVQRAVAHCESAGWIASVSTARSRVARPMLTAKGKQQAPAQFGVKSLPALRTWQHAQQMVGLHVFGRAAGQRPLDIDALAAVILAQRQHVPASVEGLPAVVDYLAWRALGVETTKPFTIDAVQRHVLRALVPSDVRVDKTVWRRMLAMRALGANGHDAEALTRALLARRPKGSRAAPKLERARAPRRKMQTASANTNAPRTTPQPTLADFAAAVREAAQLPTVARFHDDRAYIGSIWDHMRGRKPLGDMPLPEFKLRLIAAHRDGLLRITRADLVGAMDRNEVERSESRYQDATFHFVALDSGGVG